jgi:hypothetical protein
MEQNKLEDPPSILFFDGDFFPPRFDHAISFPRLDRSLSFTLLKKKLTYKSLTGKRRVALN